MSNLKALEAVAVEFAQLHEIATPPIPIETILQNPGEAMWEGVDITQLSGSFLSLRDQYSPRMSLARMLARHLVGSDWGAERKLPELVGSDEDTLRAFARMLIMPESMLGDLTGSERNPTTIGIQFEVPEEDARLRLEEWQ